MFARFTVRSVSALMALLMCARPALCDPYPDCINAFNGACQTVALAAVDAALAAYTAADNAVITQANIDLAACNNDPQCIMDVNAAVLDARALLAAL